MLLSSNHTGLCIKITIAIVFSFLRMTFIILLMLSTVALVCGFGECPTECVCNLDYKGRYQTICNRGGMSSIPILEMDPNTEVLIIRGPRNDLTIGPMFSQMKFLEVIRVTDSNVPSVGIYSFWGADRLQILGKSIFTIFSFTSNISIDFVTYVYFLCLFASNKFCRFIT